MTVTIFGASGMVGKQLIIHALAKGWKVRAFGRQIDEMLDKEDLNKNNFSAIKGYVFDAGDVTNALRGCDAVLSALGGDIDGSDHTRSLGIKNIVTQMEKNGPKRIVVLGGLGVLDDPERDGMLFENDDYPRQFVPVAREHYAAYLHLKQSTLDWSFICAPNIVNAEADGKFEAIAETPASGREINAGNLALCMVQVIASGSFDKQRVGIANS